MTKTLAIISTAFILLVSSFQETKFFFDHNSNRVAGSAFKFENIASPAKDDAGAKAKLTLVDGEMDPGAADLSALTDGGLPANEDDPGANFFFRAGTFGGRFRMDFGSVIEIEKVNSYSWHPNTRGPQLYKLYGADGSEPNFNVGPKRGIDPATQGWKFITTVSTLPQRGEDGGQYAVEIRNMGGSLGKFRYLLFDCYVTELNDDWGNTFYSEVDVVEKK